MVMSSKTMFIIRLKLKDQGIHDSWGALRRAMRGHIRVTTTMRSSDGKHYTSKKQSNPKHGNKQSTEYWNSTKIREKA